MSQDPTDTADTPPLPRSSEPSPSGVAYLRWSGQPEGTCYYSSSATRLLALDPARPASIGHYLRRVHRDDRSRVRRLLDRAAQAQERAVFEHRWTPSSRVPSPVTLLWCGAAADAAPGEVLAVLLDVDGAHRYHHSTEADSVPALLTELAQLSAAVVSRDIIGQAKGILMARHGCDADEAFRLLSALSNRTNVPVNSVAERLVTHKDPL